MSNDDGGDPEGWAWPYTVVGLILLLAFVVWYAGLAR